MSEYAYGLGRTAGPAPVAARAPGARATPPAVAPAPRAARAPGARATPPATAPAPRAVRAPGARTRPPGRRRRRPRRRGWRGPSIAWVYPPVQPVYAPAVIVPSDPFVVACEAQGGAYARGTCWLPDGSTRTRAQGLSGFGEGATSVGWLVVGAAVLYFALKR